MCDFSWTSNFVGPFSFCFFRTKCFCFDSGLEGDVDYEEADFEEKDPAGSSGDLKLIAAHFGEVPGLFFLRIAIISGDSTPGCLLFPHR